MNVGSDVGGFDGEGVGDTVGAGVATHANFTASLSVGVDGRRSSTTTHSPSFHGIVSTQCRSSAPESYSASRSQPAPSNHCAQTSPFEQRPRTETCRPFQAKRSLQTSFAKTAGYESSKMAPPMSSATRTSPAPQSGRAAAHVAS